MIGVHIGNYFPHIDESYGRGLGPSMLQSGSEASPLAYVGGYSQYCSAIHGGYQYGIEDAPYLRDDSQWH